MRLSTLNRNQFDAGSADFQLSVVVDGFIRLEVQYVLQVEALPKEVFAERLRVESGGYFFVIVAPGVEMRFGSQAAKIVCPPMWSQCEWVTKIVVSEGRFGAWARIAS